MTAQQILDRMTTGYPVGTTVFRDDQALRKVRAQVAGLREERRELRSQVKQQQAEIQRLERLLRQHRVALARARFRAQPTIGQMCGGVR